LSSSSPSSSSKLPLARPAIGEAEQAAQARALASGRLVLGPETLAFEAGLARASGTRAAVAVASGTGALHAALWALALPPGGEVLVPAFTFPAPAHAAAALGLRPVAVDVDPETWNRSPRLAEAALSPRTCAIVSVDQFGMLADYEALGRLAAGAGVPLVEDAACALGARDRAGRAAGSFGAVGCMSFHPRKIITTGEGGAVMGNDLALLERVRELRHHGQSAPGRFVRIGLNFRLAEPAAAIGVAQLERLTGLIAERKARVKTYRAALAELPITRTLGQQADSQSRVWQTFCVVLAENVERGRVIAELASAGIEAGAATYALGRIGSLATATGILDRPTPVADMLHERALALPLYHGMSDADVSRVVSALAEAIS
jgi:dTDP-4-amino-4,6-dideoxygalactose transaminase